MSAKVPVVSVEVRSDSNCSQSLLNNIERYCKVLDLGSRDFQFLKLWTIILYGLLKFFDTCCYVSPIAHHAANICKSLEVKAL